MQLCNSAISDKMVWNVQHGTSDRSSWFKDVFHIIFDTKRLLCQHEFKMQTCYWNFLQMYFSHFLNQMFLLRSVKIRKLAKLIETSCSVTFLLFSIKPILKAIFSTIWKSRHCHVVISIGIGIGISIWI